MEQFQEFIGKLLPEKMEHKELAQELITKCILSFVIILLAMYTLIGYENIMYLVGFFPYFGMVTSLVVCVLSFQLGLLIFLENLCFLWCLNGAIAWALFLQGLIFSLLIPANLPVVGLIGPVIGLPLIIVALVMGVGFQILLFPLVVIPLYFVWNQK